MACTALAAGLTAATPAFAHTPTPAVRVAPAYPNPSLAVANSTGANYQAFVKALRLRATDGTVFYQTMFKTRPTATGDLFPVRLTTSTGKSVDLVVRASNLYVVGWYLPAPTDKFYSLNDSPAPVYNPTGKTTEVRTGFDGSYTTLERQAQTSREAVPLGRSSTDQAAIDLATPTIPLDVKKISKALLILVQETSEAARFTKIDSLVAADWTTGAPGERQLMVALENDWGSFSNWAIQKLQNPQTPAHHVGGHTVNDLQAAQQYLGVVKAA
ncbi:ribosome-inactivating family protein [Kitasatospora sp. NPDC053057]|uniref:ribosome-inactivating family protein n=1 Tax=Kitasatospora sp. NPDC053057 TaxID=3364062 RepID=UPI0037CB484E